MENLNREELKILLKEIMTEVLAEQKYICRTISPPEIVKSAKGLMNLDGLGLVPEGSSKLAKHINNRKIVEAYCSRMSSMGFQIVTDINYTGLPYGGNLLFRKPIKANQEVVSDIDELTEPVITEGLDGDEIFFEQRAKEVVDKEFSKLEEQEKKLPKKLRERRKKYVKKTVDLAVQFKKQYPNRKATVGGKDTILYKKFKEHFIRDYQNSGVIAGVTKSEESAETEEDL